MKYLSIDLETYSGVDLAKSGVYRYCESPDFEVLLFGYSADGGPVEVIDLTAGEMLPADIRSALTDPAVTKWAFNAQFERVCLSRFLGYPTGQYLDPSSWHCTMVWAATLGLPLSLEGVGAVLGLEKQKLKEGKDLIRYFCTPAKARDGSRFRHYPSDAPEKWALFKAYNLRDVETEMAIQQKLSKFPVNESEWVNYTLDQQINDRGIMLDRTLVTNAIRCDEQFKRTHMEQARSVTGLDNPNSPVQLKAWLAEKGVEADSLSKAAVADMLEKADGEIELALVLRQELAKSSVKKYTAMQTVVGSDDRARGLIQFYGANRTGRYAGRLIQVQNLPQNHLPDLDTARALVRSGNTDAVEMLYDSVPLVLSELIRTAFVPKPGCHFYVADFSAIEARVIAWIAGEHWRQEVFANGGDIYCASASQMFHVPVEKHGVNGHLRQKGKIAELALGYGGSVGALKAMGALNYGLQEEELKPLVDAWRLSNALLQKRYRNNHIEKRLVPNKGELPMYYAEGTHEAIVDIDTFNQAQERLRMLEQQAAKRSKPTRSALSGLIRCGNCGSTYRRTTLRGKHFWSCTTYYTIGKTACAAKRIPEETLITLVGEILGTSNLEPKSVKSQIALIRAEKNNVVVFCMTNGTEIAKHWNDRSRRDGWTPEMRKQAREYANQSREKQK